MDVRTLCERLGGQKAVAERLGLRPQAVNNWCARDSVPADHHVSLWQMALDAGLDWTPPGAEGLRDRLCPRPAPEAA